MDSRWAGGRRARLWIATALIAAAGFASFYRSLLEPSLGWRFHATSTGEVVGDPTSEDRVALRGVRAIEGGGAGSPVDAALVIESAGMHNEYATHNLFYRAHAKLWTALHAPQVRVMHAGGETVVTPEPRALSELGLRFWVPWLTALLSLSVGLAIWVYQPGGAATACYLIASSGYAFGMLCTASWGSRLLTQPPTGWAELHVLSHLASFMITGGLCALLWLRPRRLGGNWLLWAVAGVAALSVAADAGQWLDTISLAFRLPIVLLNVVLGLLFALQWRACRHDPVQRAQLKWFGLLLAMALSAVFVAYGFGAAGHVVDYPQNYGLVTVAVLFLGLVPLVTRVGLFQLEAWWPRAWMWFFGGLSVVAIDLLLMGAFDWGADKALALSVALGGWLYFPLRQALWERLSRGTLPTPPEVLPEIVRLVTHAQGGRAVSEAMWRELWDTVFEPQRIALAPVDALPGVRDEGRRLWVVAASLPPLELELPERGNRLFGPADARRAAEICALVRQGLAAAEAFEHGARQERRRIASDLHDDLGAQLLTIAQGSTHWHDRERVASLARQALEEMRLSVRGMVGEAAPLDDVLADWRAESVTRLAAAGIDAVWEAGDAPNPIVLPARTVVQMTRVLREAVSNVIRHSGGHRCRIHITADGDALQLVVEDDGRGLGADAPRRQGNGLGNIERRVRSLGGTHAWSPGEKSGTRLEVRVPLVEVAGAAGIAG